MLLTVALALALSILPTTQPGLGPDEGVFLQTQADDGGPVDYFIAQGARHAVLDADVQAELRLNPLWPFRVAPRDEVLVFPEGAPVGSARLGRLGQPSVAEDQVVVADDQALVAEEDVVADDGAVVADDGVVADDDAVADDAEQTYTVKRGDTLIGIAAHFSTTEADLMAVNNLTNRNRIYAGQVLLV